MYTAQDHSKRNERQEWHACCAQKPPGAWRYGRTPGQNLLPYPYAHPVIVGILLRFGQLGDLKVEIRVYLVRLWLSLHVWYHKFYQPELVLSC